MPWLLDIFELVFLFPLDKYPEVELLDHIVFLYLIFCGTSILFSRVAAPFTFPPMAHKGSIFSASLPTCVISCLFYVSYPNGCEVVSHCGFDLHFSVD